MPTLLLNRRPIPRDNRVLFALVGLLMLETPTLRAAGTNTGAEGNDVSWLSNGSPVVSCTLAEVPCRLLAP